LCWEGTGSVSDSDPGFKWISGSGSAPDRKSGLRQAKIVIKKGENVKISCLIKEFSVGLEAFFSTGERRLI
jgi:hypothetical protein